MLHSLLLKLKINFIYIYKGGNCILTKALSLEIFESGVCIKKINWYDEMKEGKFNEEL